MGRPMHDSAEPYPVDQHPGHYTLKSKPYLQSHTSSVVCLGRALLSCRGVVKSVEPFLFHVALFFLLGFLLKLLWMVSPLLFDLLHPIYIAAFLCRRLCDAFTFVLLTFTIGFLCFLFSNIPMNSTYSAGQDSCEAPILNRSKIRRKRKNIGAQFSDNGDSTDVHVLSTPDLFRLDWLETKDSSSSCEILETEDDHSSLGGSSSTCESEAEYDQFFEEGEGLPCKPQPHEAAAVEPACSTAFAIKDTECTCRVLQAMASSNNKQHRSKSYSSGLNRYDNAALATAPEPCMGHRRASLSCDWGSSTESHAPPWLQNTHADLRSPPLPPLNALETLLGQIKSNNSFASEIKTSALVLQRHLVPWRAPHISDHEKAALESITLKKPPDTIDYGEVLNYHGRDELHERLEAFIAQQQRQWKLHR